MSQEYIKKIKADMESLMFDNLSKKNKRSISTLNVQSLNQGGTLENTYPDLEVNLSEIQGALNVPVVEPSLILQN